MSIFRNKADELPIKIITLFFLIDVIIFFSIDNRLIIIFWFLMSIWPKGNICAWNHHHQHYLTFRSPLYNRLLEFIYGLQTGVTTKGWYLHHVLGHHKNYLNQELDESRWMKKNGEAKSELAYTLEVAATSFYRICKVGLKHKKQLRDFLIMCLLTLITLISLFIFNWFNALFLFLLPMIIGLILTSWATYDHHSNLNTQNEFESSRNIMNSFYNLMTGNLGYHTAHHVKCGLHWSKLPDYHATIAHKIPAHCFLEVGVPYSWFKSFKKTGGLISFNKIRKLNFFEKNHVSKQ